MSVKDSYNEWAESYDSSDNKTRDLEKIAAVQTLKNYDYNVVVELGCGTGKNTDWISKKAKKLIAIDFSDEMLLRANEKIKSDNVTFIKADLTQEWKIEDDLADLITCSLVLEHIYDLRFIFSQAFKKLKSGGRFYVCELHPFKQYKGTKARYETEGGTVELEVFIHHVSDFTHAALSNGFRVLELKEWFDAEDEKTVPRLISFVFEKP